MWYVGAGCTYKRPSYSKFHGRLCRSGITEKHWKFVCMWRCGIAYFCIYTHFLFKVWNLINISFSPIYLIDCWLWTISFIHVAVNENDVRKTMRDAIPRMLSWIMRFKNTEVHKNHLSFFLKLYFFCHRSVSFAVVKCNWYTSRPYCDSVHYCSRCGRQCVLWVQHVSCIFSKFPTNWNWVTIKSHSS